MPPSASYGVPRMSPKSRSRSSGSTRDRRARRVRRSPSAVSTARARSLLRMRAIPSGASRCGELRGLPPAARGKRRRRQLDDAGRVQIGLAVTGNEDGHATATVATPRRRHRRTGAERRRGRPPRGSGLRRQVAGLEVQREVLLGGRRRVRRAASRSCCVLDLELGGLRGRSCRSCPRPRPTRRRGAPSPSTVRSWNVSVKSTGPPSDSMDLERTAVDDEAALRDADLALDRRRRSR